MVLGKKITKNTLALILREALNKGALFILFIMVGRFLGKEALGRYSLALAVSQIFFFGTELGLNTLVMREIAKAKASAGKFVLNVGILRVILGFATLFMIWLAVLVLGAKGEAATVIWLCAISYFLVSILSLFVAVFRAFEKMELDLYVSAFKSVIFLPAAAWMLLNGSGLVPVFNIFLVSNIAALFLAAVIILKEIGIPKWEPDLVFCRQQLMSTTPLWLSQFFGIAYLKMAPMLLFRMRGEEAVGLYNAGLVVVDGFWVIAGCFVISVFPVISNLSAVSMPEAKKGYLKGLKFLFLSFSAIGVALILAAPYVVRIFYGNNFAEVIPVFRLMAVVGLLVVLDTHNSLAIIAIGRQFVLPFINAGALLVNYALNVVLIGSFGYTGSAYALLASELLVFGFMMMSLKKFFRNK